MAGDVDASIGFPPEPKKPCPRDAGHVIVNIANDRPWSNYFCCMAVPANTDFMRSNPVATKRALRALKATDICHQQPERAAQWMGGCGFSPRVRYDDHERHAL